MTTPTTTSRVPYDILSVLCDTLDAKADAQTLSAFSLANSTFHRAAVAFLFRQLELSPNVGGRKRISPPLSILLSKPHLAPYVRRIVQTGDIVGWPYATTLDWPSTFCALSKCTNVEEFTQFGVMAFTFQDTLLSTLVSRNPFLRRVALNNVDSHINEFRQLERLTVTKPCVAFIDALGTGGEANIKHLELLESTARWCWEEETPISLLTRFSNLSSLRLGSGIVKYQDLVTILSSTPKLEHLDVSYDGDQLTTPPSTPRAEEEAGTPISFSLKSLVLRLRGSVPCAAFKTILAFSALCSLETFQIVAEGQVKRITLEKFSTKLARQQHSTLRRLVLDVPSLKWKALSRLCIACPKLEELGLQIRARSVNQLAYSPLPVPNLKRLELTTPGANVEELYDVCRALILPSNTLREVVVNTQHKWEGWWSSPEKFEVRRST